MPDIAPTDFEAIDRLAAVWVERGLRNGAFETKPSALTFEERRRGPAAKAASAAVTYRHQQHKEFLNSCHTCGLWTASWCEGCYSRAVFEPALECSALCTECDQAHLVCPPCRHHGKTWEKDEPPTSAASSITPRRRRISPVVPVAPESSGSQASRPVVDHVRLDRPPAQ